MYIAVYEIYFFWFPLVYEIHISLFVIHVTVSP